MNRNVMIAGFGRVGAYTLDYLLRCPETREIHVLSRNADYCVKRINVTQIGADIMGFHGKVVFHECDLRDTARTSEIIAKTDPRVIIYTGRYVKGAKYGGLSYSKGLGYGVWISLGIPLITKLMEGVRQSGKTPFVINTSFPDGVCPALESIGLAPHTGAGNLNHLVPRIRMFVAAHYGVPARQVQIYMVGSHFLNTYVSKEGSSKGSPYFMRVLVNGYDITQDLSPEEIFSRSRIEVIGGAERNIMCASDCAAMARAIISDTPTLVHAPGPMGLPGGYPVLVQESGITLALPKDISREKAVEINQESLRCDGIEKIEDQKVYFTAQAIAGMKESYGYSLPGFFEVQRAEELAQSLVREVIEKNPDR